MECGESRSYDFCLGEKDYEEGYSEVMSETVFQLSYFNNFLHCK